MGRARGEGKEVRCMDSPTGSQINFNDQAISIFPCSLQ